MLRIVSASQRTECFVVAECGVHGSQHARNELVDAIALRDQRHQGTDPALVVGTTAEVRKDELLEAVDLVLQGHEIGDGLVAFVGIVDRLQ